MDRKELAAKFDRNHKLFVDYINALSDDELVTASNGKWTPGQQLQHVYKCNQPLAYVLSNKELLAQKFGRIDREPLSLRDMLERYTGALATGGKAPDRFLPEAVEPADLAALSQKVLADAAAITGSLDNYTDAELDSLAVPHPLLGKLTVREMVGLMGYHAKHHHEKTMENLAMSTNIATGV